MSDPTATVEDSKLVIRAEGIEISLNLASVFENLANEEAEQVARALTWGHIMREAMKRMTGEAEWWSGDDEKQGAKFLAEVAENSLKAFVILDKLNSWIVKQESNESLYYDLYHMNTFPVGNTYEWLQSRPNPYTSKTDGYEKKWGHIEAEVKKMREAMQEWIEAQEETA